jgi:5-methylcytosine-specific restriction endonuclease McrA
VIRIDREATAARRFENDKSCVNKDGTEKLFGLDWVARKEELWKRCRGRCETKGCGGEAEDPHHLVKRSELRDDRLSNLRALCRRCHNIQHKERNPRWTRNEHPWTVNPYVGK